MLHEGDCQASLLTCTQGRLGQHGHSLAPSLRAALGAAVALVAAAIVAAIRPGLGLRVVKFAGGPKSAVPCADKVAANLAALSHRQPCGVESHRKPASTGSVMTCI